MWLNHPPATLPDQTETKIYHRCDNPGNSIKDRMAPKCWKQLNGRQDQTGRYIEGTSGNTGMGLALAAWKVINVYLPLPINSLKKSRHSPRLLAKWSFVLPIWEPDKSSYYSVSKTGYRSSGTPGMWINMTTWQQAGALWQTGPGEQTEGKGPSWLPDTGGTIIGTSKYLKKKSSIKVWAIDSYGSLLKNTLKQDSPIKTRFYPYISEGFGEDFSVPENYMSVINEFTK